MCLTSPLLSFTPDSHRIRKSTVLQFSSRIPITHVLELSSSVLELVRLRFWKLLLFSSNASVVEVLEPSRIPFFSPSDCVIEGLELFRTYEGEGSGTVQNVFCSVPWLVLSRILALF